MIFNNTPNEPGSTLSSSTSSSNTIPGDYLDYTEAQLSLKKTVEVVYTSELGQKCHLTATCKGLARVTTEVL